MNPPLPSRLPSAFATALTVLARVTALLTLASVIPVIISLLSARSGTIVRALGVDRDDTFAYVMTWSGKAGLAAALIVLVGAPLAVLLASRSRRHHVTRMIAYALIGTWMARWLYGFAHVLWTFGASVGWLYWTGLVVCIAAVAGAVIGAVRAWRQPRMSRTAGRPAVTAALVVAVATVLAAAGSASAQQEDDPDSDGDGLSDFREVHKHLTDPASADSDGDGIADGDWLERREFTYTVRAVMHVIKPINADTLTDDYQDGRVLDEHEDYVEIEVILYPFNTVGQAMTGLAAWPEGDPALEPYLKPGPTTNWDEPMREALRAEALAHDIDLDALTDVEAAARLSRFLMQRVSSEDSFTTFAVDFEGDRLVIPEGARDHWAQELAKRQRTLEQQLDHELYGRGMFTNRTIGTCTSAAIYLATGMKAAGIPARSIICVPVTDGNDAEELNLAKRLTHHRVRQIVERAHRRHSNAWTSHTFNEVYVGNRWRRLNYDRLGQNILDEDFLGLMVHVHTWRDHAEAGLAAWGRRNGGDHDDVCGGANPYSCISLSDRFGTHCTLDNPPVEPALAHLTITQAYWFDLQDDPPRVQTTVQEPESAGHFFVVVQEQAAFDDYRDFYADADKFFFLVAPAQEPVAAHAARGFWIDSNRGVRDFYVYVPPEHFARIVPGVAYRLVARNPEQWHVNDDVRVVRPARWTDPASPLR